MKSIKGDVWLAFAVIAIAAVYLFMDMGLPEVRLSDPLGPKAFPALVGVGLIASALLLLLEGRSKSRHPTDVHHEAHTAPQAVGAPASASASALLNEAAVSAQAPIEATQSGAHAVQAKHASNVPQSKHPSLVLIGMVLWTGLYYVFFERAGYLVATCVFLFGLLSYFNRKRLKTNVAIALGVTVVFDLLFSQLLGVPMPTGILPF